MTAPALSVSTDHGRMYMHPGTAQMVPSITNVIGMKDKPALKWWAAREAATFAANNLDTLGALSVQERIDLIKGAPFRRTAKASDDGNMVHDWIDIYAKTGQLAETLATYDKSTFTAKNMYKQFIALRNKYDLRFTLSEFTVWSDEYGYAGTADWFGHMEVNGKSFTILGDTKTGKGVYPEVGMQLAAIANADFILDENGEQHELPKAHKYGVLHVRPRGASLIPVKNIDKCFNAFLGLRAVFEWHTLTAQNDVLGWAPKISAKTEAEKNGS